MRVSTKLFPAVFAGIALCLIILPVFALTVDVTDRVSVTEVDPGNGTLTVAAKPWIGCNTTTENCSTLTGTVPDAQVFSTITLGDQVIVAGFGEENGRFLSVAKLVENVTGTWLVTDIFGNPEQISTPLIGDYSLVITENPDCASCKNGLCNVTSANVTILSTGRNVAQKTLPMEDPTLFFNGRNDASSVNVTFVSATSRPGLCTGAIAQVSDGIPVRNYIIQVEPPIGSLKETPSETVTETQTAEKNTISATRNNTPTKAGAPLPVIAVLAAGIGMLAVALFRK